MITLTSTQNPILQKLRRAVESGRSTNDGVLAAEGPHLLQEALASGWNVEQVFCSSEALKRHGGLLSSASQRRIEVTEVSARAFKTVSDTEHTQGVLSLLRPRRFEWSDLIQSTFKTGGPLVILDGMQDPGNAGAIIRSAEAFGGAGVIFTEGCVRISNGKLLRAAAGSLFRLPFLENLPRAEIISQLRSANQTVFTLMAGGNTSLFDTPLSGSFALVVGSEGGGVSLLLRNAGQALSIPTRGVESLNAAVACSVVLCEAARQRQA